MTKEQSTALIIEAMQSKSITFQQLADQINRNVVWTASALFGQNSMDTAEAKSVVQLLGLPQEAELALQKFPSKGSESVMPPTDPLIYRLYEIVLIYGESMKAVIHEKMGDGIMSAIDFTMNIEKLENPNGDRVKITMDGKFLPYKKW
ncbi:cyanase [Pedobacter sp. P351]|uniref:cyanase n=1 Tax=Pedobacter superstes TaxID=3133441 RepID=UPI0030A6457D